jgi:hypothetical protein
MKIALKGRCGVEISSKTNQLFISRKVDSEHGVNLATISIVSYLLSNPIIDKDFNGIYKDLSIAYVLLFAYLNSMIID